ncbi:MAG: hypothetical protein K0Q52_364 [Microbacterium sp.]|nr:hypothetical protein [Microbacterium sp.]
MDRYGPATGHDPAHSHPRRGALRGGETQVGEDWSRSDRVVATDWSQDGHPCRIGAERPRFATEAARVAPGGTHGARISAASWSQVGAL